METVTSNTQDTEYKVDECLVPPTDTVQIGDTPAPVSEAELRAALRTIIRAIGEDPDRDGLRNTPDRIMRMYQEIFRGNDARRKPRITTFNNAARSSELVFDCGDFHSMCEHHMLPFFGKYYFAYVPSPEGRILGISKVARVVGYCAARLQLQERLCRDVVAMLDEALGGTALGFAIFMRGEHLCKTMRGVKSKGDMCVSHFTGCFEKKPTLRKEFYGLIALQK